MPAWPNIGVPIEGGPPSSMFEILIGFEEKP